MLCAMSGVCCGLLEHEGVLEAGLHFGVEDARAQISLFRTNSSPTDAGTWRAVPPRDLKALQMWTSPSGLQNRCGVAAPRSVGSTPAPRRSPPLQGKAPPERGSPVS